MKKYAFLLFLLLIIACKETPPEPSPTAKDPRMYAWTVDTLKYPGTFQTFMQDIWGTSPNNVYAVGGTDIGKGIMFHFDGQRWEPLRLVTTEGGTIPVGIDLHAIHGFSAINIFAVGERYYYDPLTQQFSDSSLIIHYNGTQWSEV